LAGQLAHFAIEADNVERALAFYQRVFSCEFEPWGPPEFYLIHGAGVAGALQKAHGPVGDGRRGFECSIAVEDLDAVCDQIKQAGGSVDPAASIPTVGRLAKFRDTEGNVAVVIEYEPERAKEMGLA
jgi:predicted enzyme related to lactoylglutathione lyase